MTTPAITLMERLGLSDAELCACSPSIRWPSSRTSSTIVPSSAILLALTAEAADRVGPQTLRSWLRRKGPNGVPFEHLRARDFAGFEDDLAILAERGYILRS